MRLRSASALRRIGAATLLGAARSAAQSPAVPVSRAVQAVELPVLLGSLEDDWRRTAEIAGAPGAMMPAFRSAGQSTRPAHRDSTANRDGDLIYARAVLPSVRSIYNSQLPYSENENGLWAGRGTSLAVRAGVVVEAGELRIVVLPELMSSENRAFAFRPATQPQYSPFASPWWTGQTLGTADVPTRFGDRPYTYLGLGQTSFTYTHKALAVGFASEDEWWGPALRNPIFLSNTATGFPHAFARTAHPVHTRIGDIEARYLLGVLGPSPFFYRPDIPPTYRSYVAGAITLRPEIARNLTIGIERSAVADLGISPEEVVGHAADVLLGWPRRADGSYRTTPLVGGFLRYALPADGIEVYGEWATETPPSSLRRFLLASQDGQGYTIGLQWIAPIASPPGPMLATARANAVRVRAEATNLEQSIAFRDEPIPPAFYASLSAPGGYTNRGQVLGAGIGPSGQSQWIALDFLHGARGARRAGVALTRVRWNNDALYTTVSPNFFRHDVSLLASGNVGWRTALADFSGDVTVGKRYNYQFQNGAADPGGRRTVDVPNTTISFSVTPR